MSNESYPHGECECRDGCLCVHRAGPAAFELVRGGTKLRVCTRCFMSADTDRRLLVTADDLFAPFLEWDPFGAFIVVSELQEQSARQQKNRP